MVFGAGLVLIAIELAGDALQAGAALDTSVRADPSVVRALWEGSFVFYGAIGLMLSALVLGSAGAAALATGVLSRRVAWMAIGCALINLAAAPSIFGGTDYTGFYTASGTVTFIAQELMVPLVPRRQPRDVPPGAAFPRTSMRAPAPPRHLRRMASRPGASRAWSGSASSCRASRQAPYHSRRVALPPAPGRIARPWKVDALLLTTRGVAPGRSDGGPAVLSRRGGHAPRGRQYRRAVASRLVLQPRRRPGGARGGHGRTIAVRAEVLPADAAAAWWPQILRRAPTYERYVRATSRTIPIVRLVPV